MAVMLLALRVGYVFNVLRASPIDEKSETYAAAAAWLNANAPAGAAIASAEIGVFGYHYSKGPIIDPLGLVTPGAESHIRKRRYSWYIPVYHPDYIVVKSPIRPTLENFVTKAAFLKLYGFETEIGSGFRVKIYRRIAPHDTAS